MTMSTLDKLDLEYEQSPDLVTSGHVHPLRLFDIARAEGRPLYTSAPMVRYSKLAFRQTVREYGVDLCWTPMILAKEFNRSVLARDSDFTIAPSLSPIPTIVQFAASSPLEFSRATRIIAPYVSGVDLNCGCPQSWACADCMGAALINKRELVADVVKEAKSALEREGWKDQKTVSVKIRIHSDLRHTIDLMQTVQAAGVDFITIHGRTRSQRSSEPVNLSAIKTLASHATVPIIANGDVNTRSAAHEMATSAQVDGVMSARAILSNPALFAGFDSCPWEAVETFLSHVVRAPIPFKLVLHHMTEMCSGNGGGPEGDRIISASLNKTERAELIACGSMLELIDWFEKAREVRGSESNSR